MNRGCSSQGPSPQDEVVAEGGEIGQASSYLPAASTSHVTPSDPEHGEDGHYYYYDAVPDAPPPVVTYRRPKYGAAIKATCGAVRSSITMLFLALLLSGAGFLVWPATTEVVVKQIKLDGIDVEKDPGSSTLVPSLILHISMEMLLEVTNSNYFGVSYDSIVVQIFYRGDEIGQAVLEQAEVPARSTVSVPAVLDLKGQQIFKNVAALWADTVNRKIPFDTVTQFSGAVELFSWRPQVKVCSLVIAMIACCVSVACCVWPVAVVLLGD